MQEDLCFRFADLICLHALWQNKQSRLLCDKIKVATTTLGGDAPEVLRQKTWSAVEAASKFLTFKIILPQEVDFI